MKYKIDQDIRLVCEFLSLSLEQLGRQIDVRQETLSRIINNEIVPSDEVLEKFYSYVFLKKVNLNQNKVNYYQKLHNVVLFHGSKNEIVDKISLDYSRAHVDLGVGFYVGDNYEQSLDFVCQNKFGSIYVLDVNYDDLKICELDVSLDWMMLIAINRGKLDKYQGSDYYHKIIDKYSSYDVLIAPIADNRMFTTIDDFVKSAITSEQAVHALKDLSLGKQIVFKSQKAVKHIKILERLYVSKPEREFAKQKKIEKINDADEFIVNAYASHVREGLYIGEILK